MLGKTHVTEKMGIRPGLNDVKGVRVPYVPEGMRHVFHQYTIRAERRDDLKAHLEKDMIRAGVYYPRLITENPP